MGAMGDNASGLSQPVRRPYRVMKTARVQDPRAMGEG